MIVREFGFEKRLDRGLDAIDDRSQIRRSLCAGTVELMQGCLDRATLGVPHHHDKSSAKLFGCKLDTADLRWRHDISSNTDHKQIAESLVKHNFRWHTRVRAAQDDRERLLAREQSVPLGLTRIKIPLNPSRKPAISRFESGKRVCRGNIGIA